MCVLMVLFTFITIPEIKVKHYTSLGASLLLLLLEENKQYYDVMQADVKWSYCKTCPTI